MEDMITNGFKELPKDLEQMPVEELRRQLVAVAMSYKSEKLRNQAFDQKLTLAVKQLSRREEVI